jgi:hypothetical protein
MSVANQANERLGQLVSLAVKIEGHLARNARGEEGEERGGRRGGERGGGGNNQQATQNAEALASLSTSLTELIKAVSDMDENSGDKLASFITKMSEAIQKAATAGVKKENVDSINESLEALAKGSAGFMKEMAFAVIYGFPALLCAVFFGTTLRILFGILKGVKGLDKDAQESIAMILDSAKGAILFGLAMSAYLIIGVPAMLGAAMFGASVLILSNILAKAKNLSEEHRESINGILKMALGAILFGIGMSLYTVVGITAMIGATLFGATILILSKILGKAKILSQEGLESIRGIVWLAAGAFLCGLAMSF